MQRVTPTLNLEPFKGFATSSLGWPLLSTKHIRALEVAYANQRQEQSKQNQSNPALGSAQAPRSQPTLMETAGLSLAKLCLALAPNARQIWIACGPGNNGGDGLVAAIELKKLGKDAYVSLCGKRLNSPAISNDPKTLKTSSITDHICAQQAALELGIDLHFDAPSYWDFAIDALLGIGIDQHNPRPIEGVMADWLSLINSSDSPVLCVDTPSGLCTDTGHMSLIRTQSQEHTLNFNQKRFTLTFLGLKPGLFTGAGKDYSGEVWLDTLDWIDTAQRQVSLGAHPLTDPVIYLNSTPRITSRAHNSHKGTYSDVVVLGGAKGMQGAAVLAATSALHMGAGRVYLCYLDESPSNIGLNPALMTRFLSDLPALILEPASFVCGCGAGKEITTHLRLVLSTSKNLVLDADALNAVAEDEQFKKLLSARSASGLHTVLTPHPLEAARLLGITTQQVQVDRVQCAKDLARVFRCAVVLKGSGTVIAQYDGLNHKHSERVCINPTGCALLASAGTGDVLAGMIAALLAQSADPWLSACEAVFIHGLTAQNWGVKDSFDSTLLAERVTYPRLRN